VAEVAVGRLDRGQVAAYVSAWLEAARPPDSPAILFTPDALRLLAHRSQGSMGRVGVLAENMLLLAAWERRRTVSSWEGWAASDRERWFEKRAPASLPRRPPSWPTAAALEVIDSCRAAEGVPPWPLRPAADEPAR